MKKRFSHGSGEWNPSLFSKFGKGVIIEPGVLIFHPENIKIGNGVYIGHNTILKGYYKGTMEIGDGSWIGQQCFFHSAGNLIIGNNVGIGPGVKILTSEHESSNIEKPIIEQEVRFSPVVIEDDSDIGVGSIILPGVKIGRGAQIGAGAVVNNDIPPYSVAVGVPAKTIRTRKSHP